MTAVPGWETLRPPTSPPPGMTGPELCRAAGITYRQLDYWTRLGILRDDRTGTGSGLPRQYAAAEAGVAACIARLIASGLALQAAAYVARQGPPVPPRERRHELTAGASLLVDARCWDTEPLPVPRQHDREDHP